jgi:hypothetical protein
MLHPALARFPGPKHLLKGRTASVHRAASHAAAAIVAAAIIAAAASPALGATQFPDVPPGTDVSKAVSVLSAQQVISGHKDGTFGPDESIYRAQFAKMIAIFCLMNATEADVCTFVDVEKGGPDTLYPDNYVAVAASEGIILGTSPTRFAPYDHISLAQVVTMVIRSAQRYHPGLLAAPPSGWFGRFNASDPTHGANIVLAEYNDLLATVEDGRSFWDPATRGEVAQLLVHLQQKFDGAWDESSMSLAEAATQIAQLRSDEVFLPERLPDGWTIADPFQVGPGAEGGYLGDNPSVEPESGGSPAPYSVTFTDGTEIITLEVDWPGHSANALDDWLSHSDPQTGDAGFSLAGASWQLWHTSDTVLVAVQMPRAGGGDAYWIAFFEPARLEDAALEIARSVQAWSR